MSCEHVWRDAAPSELPRRDPAFREARPGERWSTCDRCRTVVLRGAPDDTLADLDGVLGRDDARRLFDARVRATLGISGREFLRRADAGAYEGTDDPNVRTLLVMSPFAR